MNTLSMSFNKIILLVSVFALVAFSTFFINTTQANAQASECIDITQNLYFGKSGAEVTSLQQYLVEENLLDMGNSNYGFFGFKTRNAVIQWQQSNGISPALGIFGPESRAKLKDLTCTKPLSNGSAIILHPLSQGYPQNMDITLLAQYASADGSTDDTVAWAIRSSCDTTGETLFGNVGGKNTPFTWDGKIFNSQFNLGDTEPGTYCFIFNPHETSGVDVRETKEFTVVTITDASAVITSPNNSISAYPQNTDITLSAVYGSLDGSTDDLVKWAIRSSCDTTGETLFGNVGGKNTPFTWDGRNFHSEFNLGNTAPGTYCFIFNPLESNGPNIRQTREFPVSLPPAKPPIGQHTIVVSGDVSIEGVVNSFGKWEKGDENTVKWNPVDFGTKKVDVIVCKVGGQCWPSSASTLNDGQEDLKLFEKPAGDYYFLVREEKNPGLFMRSQVFGYGRNRITSFDEPDVTMSVGELAPEQPESIWLYGEIKVVTWEPSDFKKDGNVVNKVDVILCKMSGDIKTGVRCVPSVNGLDTANDGTHEMRMSTIHPSGEYFVIVRVAKSPSSARVTQGFQLQKFDADIEITGFETDRVWKHGKDNVITWDTDAFLSNDVDVILCQKGNQCWPTGSMNVPNTGEASVHMWSNKPVGGNYYIKVRSVRSEGSAQKSEVFEVAPKGEVLGASTRYTDEQIEAIIGVLEIAGFPDHILALVRVILENAEIENTSYDQDAYVRIPNLSSDKKWELNTSMRITWDSHAFPVDDVSIWVCQKAGGDCLGLIIATPNDGSALVSLPSSVPLGPSSYILLKDGSRPRVINQTAVSEYFTVVSFGDDSPTQKTYHSADTNLDYRISDDELETFRTLYYSTSGYACGMVRSVVGGGGFQTYVPGTSPRDCSYHSADTNQDYLISLPEFLRVIQLKNASSYKVQVGTVDGFKPVFVETTTVVETSVNNSMSTASNPVQIEYNDTFTFKWNSNVVGNTCRFGVLSFPSAVGSFGLLNLPPSGQVTLRNDKSVGTTVYPISIRCSDSSGSFVTSTSYVKSVSEDGSDTIVIISPNGGEEYTTGDTVDITWNNGFGDHAVEIQLLNAKNNLVRQIVFANDGLNGETEHYRWTIPSNIVSAGYKIKISGVGCPRFIGQVCSDMSNEVFVIKAVDSKNPNIQVQFGEWRKHVWYHGETETITWNKDAFSTSNVDVILCTANKSKCYPTALNTTNDGSVSVKMYSDKPAGEYVIKVRRPGSDSTSKFSDVFTVAQKYVAPTGTYHSADLNRDYRISDDELGAFQQIYLSNTGFYCSHALVSSDGSVVQYYAAGTSPRTCAFHSADTNQDWKISLPEFLRVIQLKNGGTYEPQEGTVDGFDFAQNTTKWFSRTTPATFLVASVYNAFNSFYSTINSAIESVVFYGIK